MRIKTEIPITSAFIKHALGKKYTPDDSKKQIRAITTDSREVKKGDAFIGLSGESFDGSRFIPEVKRLASLTIGSDSSLADIKLENPNSALLLLAKSYKKLLSIKSTVAITATT